jgi:GTP 3',8-cyclase
MERAGTWDCGGPFVALAAVHGIRNAMSAVPLEAPRTLDSRGRALRDLRLSVTDRCNFRCTYCMPKEVFTPDFPYLPKTEVLSFEELTRLTRLFIAIGVEKVRLTGGEPTLRRGLPDLIAMLTALPGLRDIALTTNGSALSTIAQPLKDAGLQRLTVSLDAIDDATFRAMNDVDFPVHRVLRGIDAAQAAGLAPIKVNMVVKRGVNEDQLVPMLQHFSGTGCIVRFIEFMDVGTTNGWRMDHVITAADILSTIRRVMDVTPLPPTQPGETAQRYRHAGGEFGIIASVSQPFCQGCTRARITASGQLHTCLFNARGHDLRSMLRSSLSDEELIPTLRRIWQARDDRYSERRTAGGTPLRPEMSRIGG